MDFNEAPLKEISSSLEHHQLPSLSLQNLNHLNKASKNISSLITSCPAMKPLTTLKNLTNLSPLIPDYFSKPESLLILDNMRQTFAIYEKSLMILNPSLQNHFNKIELMATLIDKTSQALLLYKNPLAISAPSPESYFELPSPWLTLKQKTEEAESIFKSIDTFKYTQGCGINLQDSFFSHLKKNKIGAPSLDFFNSTTSNDCIDPSKYLSKAFASESIDNLAHIAQNTANYKFWLNVNKDGIATLTEIAYLFHNYEPPHENSTLPPPDPVKRTYVLLRNAYIKGTIKQIYLGPISLSIGSMPISILDCIKWAIENDYCLDKELLEYYKISLLINKPKDISCFTMLNENKNNIFSHKGDFYEICYERLTIIIKKNNGLIYLEHLLTHPNTDSSILELYRLVNKSIPTDYSTEVVDYELNEVFMNEDIYHTEPTIDQKTIDTCNTRIKEINELLKKISNQKSAKAEALRSEEIEIANYLNSQKNIKGKPRILPNVAERIRQNVSKSIHTAIGIIQEKHKKLGAHLDSCIFTQTSTWTYRPNIDTQWNKKI